MSFEQVLQVVISEEIEGIKETMSLGQMDPAKYQRESGRIEAFRKVIDDCFTETHKRLDQ